MNNITTKNISIGSPRLQAGTPTRQTGKLTNFANIICSRESTYRTFLDLVSFDLPAMLASTVRNFKNFLETTFECLYGTAILFASPFITSSVAKITGKFILPKEIQQYTKQYLKFSMKETENLETLKEGIDRLTTEEIKDKDFIASLFKKAGKETQAKQFEKEAKEIKEFSQNFTASKEMAKHIKKLKSSVIIIESLIEGSWSASVGLVTRLFRKYVLGEDRFTGTKGYVSDEESGITGDSEEINVFQKLLTGAMCFLAPVTNSILLKKSSTKEALANNRFLNTVQEQLDMTHGVYPKLGLLLSYTVPPKWIGQICLSQGNLERGEKILKLLTVVTSWWFGHRFTNGLLAKKADKELAKKYGIKEGMLVDSSYLNTNPNDNLLMRIRNKYPEPAKINHVFNAIDETNLDETKKEELRFEAEEKHAKCLYWGFTLHAALVWGINMAVNGITKLRAKRMLAA